jgi:hypothetical protein
MNYLAANKGEDWYPYYAPKTVIAALQRKGITPAHCWIADATLAGGRCLPECPIVTIWGRDMAAFNRAVKRDDRIAIVLMTHAGQRILPDLAALASEVARR